MVATYRLQLTPSFGFADARAVIPYLRELGVSHLYLSPALEARRGSMHGYDVIDPGRVREELGGEQGLRALAAEGMPILLDTVPNHMAVAEENRYWHDPELRERFFDIDPATGAHRRFFDIDDLAGVRQEDPEVFAATHAKVLELLREGVIWGLRIDHPDGLADPAGYLGRLRESGAERVWVEKILARDEPLRDWPVQGTVGYEFLADVGELFVDPAGEEPLTELLAEFTGERRGFAEVAREAKLEQACNRFSVELERLHRVVPDLEPAALPTALAALPVYRTYVEPSGAVTEADRLALADVEPQLRRALLLEDPAPAELITRFQQTSPPVTAKGIEDTAFYRYMRLIALNEVGGDPDCFSLSVEDFHARNAERLRRFPSSLLTTHTHDTKRSADARARIAALSACPDRWREHVLRWRELNAPLHEGDAPDASEEYLLYQTLIGVWPIEIERLTGYLEKALREGKRNSSWAEPDEQWEAGVCGFARRVVESELFLRDFEPFCGEMAAAGERIGLGQVLLKLTSPGVPDIYQGDELLNLALVDPDNRRPVDWDARRAALRELRGGTAATRATRKLDLIWRGLELRARRPEAFAGAYEPVAAGEGVCAFVRGEGAVLVVVGVREWEGAELEGVPAGTWREVLGDRERQLGGGAAVADLVNESGLALWERV